MANAEHCSGAAAAAVVGDPSVVALLAQLFAVDKGGVGAGGLHSSTFRFNVSTFCRICWVHDIPPSLLDRGTQGGVTKTA
jgi:hypothetical protein